jgi:hypothetical protein
MYIGRTQFINKEIVHENVTILIYNELVNWTLFCLTICIFAKCRKENYNYRFSFSALAAVLLLGKVGHDKRLENDSIGWSQDIKKKTVLRLIWDQELDAWCFDRFFCWLWKKKQLIITSW